MTLHIIDDSVLFQDRIRQEVEDVDGLRISSTSETAGEAIARIYKDRPAVIILDISLRKGTGMDVLRYLTTLHIVPTVFVVTNHPMEHYKKVCMELGADRYFHKSTQYDQLISALRELPLAHAGSA